MQYTPFKKQNKIKEFVSKLDAYESMINNKDKQLNEIVTDNELTNNLFSNPIINTMSGSLINEIITDDIRAIKKPHVAPGFKSNVKHLEGYVKYAPSKEYQDKIKDAINL